MGRKTMATNAAPNLPAQPAAVGEPSPADASRPRTADPRKGPIFRPSQEVRLAVVMYGGVSLAIYMNGIAEELYHLVRATAPDPDDRASERAMLLADPADEAQPDGRAGVGVRSSSGARVLRSTERVYRQLGQILERGRIVDCTPWKPEDGAPPVRTRFVVDILSGTSAGGINAIFLAKALANNQPFEHLKRMWIEEGDIGRLINDEESVRDLGGRLAPARPPRSLLNSQRLYVKLLEAFRDMGLATGDRRSAFVDKLDLYVTTTDIRGVPVPLQLDEVVYERRHRHVFHFRYDCDPDARPLNDFVTGNDPFLAFAARCTSAFPLALEPMQMRDIRDMAGTVTTPGSSGRYPAHRDEWRDLFSGYEGDDVEDRAYADGGYLDNRPFSYAIDTLAHRDASIPVDRKLLFIDPSPEPPDASWRDERTPNVVENIVAAFSLARYETIREDLQRVLDGNRLLQKVSRITWGIEEDLNRRAPPRRFDAERWAGMDLGDMLRRWGITYAAYHHVKVADTTDEVACYITAGLGLDPRTDAYEAVRYFVRAWRDANYVDYRDKLTNEKPTQNRFLLRYDLAYRLRRLSFVQRKVEELLAALDGFPRKDVAYDLQAGREQASRQIGAVIGTGGGRAPEAPLPTSKEDWEAVRSELIDARKRLDEIRRHLVAARVRLRAPRLRAPRDGRPDHPLWQSLEETGLRRELLALLSEFESLRSKQDDRPVSSRPDTAAREGARGGFATLAGHAQRYVDDSANTEKLQHLAEAIAGEVSQATRTASDEVKALLSPRRYPKELIGVRRAAREALWHYYDHYDFYDIAILPALYGTNLGEADEVEIVRVSPKPPGAGREHANGQPAASQGSKLGGSRFFHFGAFLDERWRRNDILWGRLDGAEHLIRALVPPGPEGEAASRALQAEAYRTIIEEELIPADRETARALMLELLSETLRRPAKNGTLEQVLRDMVEKNLVRSVDSSMVKMLRRFLDTDSLRAHLQSPQFQVHPPEPEPRAMVQALARGTQVVGRIIEDLAPTCLRRAAWVARLGRMIWGLAEVAVPRSFANLLFVHWRNLVSLFAVLLVAISIPLGNPALVTSGVTMLAVIFILSVVVATLGRYLEGRLLKGRWGAVALGRRGSGT